MIPKLLVADDDNHILICLGHCALFTSFDKGHEPNPLKKANYIPI